MRTIFAFLAGALFGAGLFISGMTDTSKVQGWLDVFGAWDPTLAFVMGGAILPMAAAWAFARGRKPVLAEKFPKPVETKLDRGLVFGSMLFGAGWALVGLCPGPALASLSYGGWGHWVFLAAMLAGMGLAVPVRSRVNLTA